MRIFVRSHSVLMRHACIVYDKFRRVGFRVASCIPPKGRMVCKTMYAMISSQGMINSLCGGSNERKE